MVENLLVKVSDDIDALPAFHNLIKVLGFIERFHDDAIFFMNLSIGHVKVRDVIIFETPVVPYG